MPRYVFLALAAGCLLQRTVEIARNDRRVLGRRQSGTAIAITVLFLGFTVSSVVETFVAGRDFNPSISIAGGCLFAAGFAIRRWVLQSLGKLWAIDVDLKPDHDLVTTGPYRFCRHPNYSAMLLEMVGICLMGNAYATLVVFFPLYVVALAARMRIEETALVARFGDQYREYRQRTFALWPTLRRSGR